MMQDTGYKIHDAGCRQKTVIGIKEPLRALNTSQSIDHGPGKIVDG